MEIKKVGGSNPPDWVLEYRRRTKLIDIIAGVFEHDCDCPTCIELRKIADDLGSIFFPQEGGRAPRR